MTAWKEPQTVEEVMLAGAEFARREGAWARRTWISRTPESYFKTSGEMTCGDVRACAGGILAIVLRNGPLLKRWSSATLRITIAEEVRTHPLGVESSKVLAKALLEVLNISESSSWYRHVADTDAALDVVVSCNDNHARTSEQIVAAFVRGAEMARAAATV